MFSFMGTEKVGKCPAVDRGGRGGGSYSFTELLSLMSHYMYQQQQLIVYIQRWPVSCYAVSSLMLKYFKK